MSGNKEEIDKCEITVVHKDVIKKIEKKLMNENSAYNLSEFFKIFSDVTRIKIIQILSVQELCVCDITAILNMTQSAVSHQLKILRQYRIVKPKKSGKMVYYSLIDKHIADIFNEAMLHLSE